MTESASTSRQANYALLVLLLAYILSFIDRNAMAVLVGPIRADFDISDFQYSLLHGFAFSMFYIFLGLPIARLADCGSRKSIIAGSVGTILGGWSVRPLLQRGYSDASVRIVMWIAIIWMIPAAIGPMLPTGILALWRRPC